MFRIALSRSKSILYCSAVPVTALATSEKTANKVQDAKPDAEEFVFVETGWERVQNLFKPTQYENVSPELRALLGSTSFMWLMGSIMGSFVFSRHSYMDFVGNNHASRFESHLDAKAVLTHNMIGSMTRGAIVWGNRFALVTFTWISLTRLIGAYQGEIGWPDQIGGGTLTGAVAGYLFRDFKLLQVEKAFKRGRFFGGPLSVVGGAAIGCLIGVATGAIYEFDKSDSTKHDVRYWAKYWESHRLEKQKKDPNYKPDN